MSAPSRDDPYRQIVLDVEGPRADELPDDAVRQAALFLRENISDLYAAEVGRIVVAERSQFRRHLGEQGAVLRWKCSVTVRLRPEIVRERRDRAEGKPPEKLDLRTGRGLHVVPPSEGG